MSTPPLWVIGLDGASFNLIDPLAARGLLPNLEAIMREGVRADLRSTVPHQTPVAWTTYATGTDPGVHGIYGWWSPDVQAGRLVPTSGRRVDGARFWEVLSAAGLRVGVVNVPMTYPARPVNGFLMAGLDAPSFTPEQDAHFCYPRDLPARLARDGLGYELFPPAIAGEPLASMAERWIAGERTRVAATLHLARDTRPDFLQVNLFMTDYFTHRTRDPDEVLDRVYAAADELVGEIAEAAGDATLMVVSDHGSQPIDRLVLVHNVLRDHGLLEFEPWLADEQASRVLGLPAAHPEVVEFVARLRREGPRLRAELFREAQSDHPGANVGFSTIDWDRTLAFSASDYGQVQLNRARGEGARAVLRNEAAVIARVQTALSSVEGVELHGFASRSELYPEAPAGEAPDVTPILDDHSAYFCQVYSFYGDGESREVVPVSDLQDPVPTGSVGDHHPDGILLARGSGMPAGTRLAGAGLRDIAPTVLSYFGLDGLPEHGGSVLGDLWGGTRAEHGLRAVQHSPGDQPDALRSRLFDLGYRV